MSPDTSTPTKASKEGISYPRELALSRWAPGGIEDQNAAIENADTPKTSNIASSSESANATKPDNTTADKQSKIASKDLNKTPSNKETKTVGGKQDETETTASNRIIGPLTEEEKSVKLENPFFNPDKDKGLSSSRWTNQ
ncbi:hypothetical protein Daus18300_002568 [Diaporthe australafricana]|uniref:Uncharacterized protein n=1 Tax=Diaporthe australafricana TaxID=127596 RepID=A0ABR3XLU5_9PEZI